jgi:hypothetical protein
MNASTLFRSLACVGLVVLFLSPVACENFPFPGEPRAGNDGLTRIDSVFFPDTIFAPNPITVRVKGTLPNTNWTFDRFDLVPTGPGLLIAALARERRRGEPTPALLVGYDESLTVTVSPIVPFLDVQVIGSNRIARSLIPVVPRPLSRLLVSVDIEKLPVMAPFDAYRFTLNMQNRAPASLDLHFSSTQIYDFTVYDRQGKVLWQWSHDKAFGQVAWTMTLGPREEKSYSEMWHLLNTASVPHRLVGCVVSTPGGEAERLFK